MNRLFFTMLALGFSIAAYCQSPIVSTEAARSNSQNVSYQQNDQTSAQSNDGKVVELSDATFRTLIYPNADQGEYQFQGDLPTVVDFSATWCGPCKQFAPTFAAMAKKYAGKINFYKVDVDKCPKTSAALGIQSIPTVLFIPIYNEPRIISGAPSASEFESYLKDNVLDK